MDTSEGHKVVIHGIDDRVGHKVVIQGIDDHGGPVATHMVLGASLGTETLMGLEM